MQGEQRSKFNHVLVDRFGKFGRAYFDGAGEWRLEDGTSAHAMSCLFIAKLNDDGTVDTNCVSVSPGLKEALRGS